MVPSLDQVAGAAVAVVEDDRGLAATRRNKATGAEDLEHLAHGVLVHEPRSVDLVFGLPAKPGKVLIVPVGSNLAQLLPRGKSAAIFGHVLALSLHVPHEDMDV